MMLKRELLYFMIFVIFASIVLIIFYKRGTTSDPCEIQKELYKIKIDSGLVINKYIDSENHAMKTLTVKTNDGDYQLLFIHYENWAAFDSVKIMDEISKSPNSFVFVVNNEFTFELKLDCEYN